MGAPNKSKGLDAIASNPFFVQKHQKTLNIDALEGAWILAPRAHFLDNSSAFLPFMQTPCPEIGVRSHLLGAQTYPHISQHLVLTMFITNKFNKLT